MYKICVIGDYASIYGFSALGLTTFPVDHMSDDEAARVLRNAAESAFGIIYITEGLAKRLSHEISRYQTRTTPAIVLIPGVSGNTGQGIESIKKSVEQAVGSDILFQNS